MLQGDWLSRSVGAQGPLLDKHPCALHALSDFWGSLVIRNPGMHKRVNLQRNVNDIYIYIILHIYIWSFPFIGSQNFTKLSGILSSFFSCFYYYYLLVVCASVRFSRLVPPLVLLVAEELGSEWSASNLFSHRCRPSLKVSVAVLPAVWMGSGVIVREGPGRCSIRHGHMFNILLV